MSDVTNNRASGMNGCRKTAVGLVAACALASIVSAADASDRTEPPVLTIETPDASVAFTRAELLEMRQVEFTTGTIWTSQPATYQGPPLRSVLERAGVTGGVVNLKALNAYFAPIDVDDLEALYPIVAVLADGEPMKVREKGPLWVMYPYDSHEKYQTETIYANSVWQLVEITTVTDK